MDRRAILTSIGLASVGALAAGRLVLAKGVDPTPASGDGARYADFLRRNGEMVAQAAPAAAPLPRTKSGLILPSSVKPTEKNILGPYYRLGAPTRYTVVGPYEPGVMVVVSGRVWGYDTKAPLPGAEIHIWQADKDGHYENEADPDNPPAEFVNRIVLFADENGAYEYQTVHPGRYLNGNQYRPSHIHYKAKKPGYKELTTQLYFKDDPYNKVDPFIRPSLIVPFGTKTAHGRAYESGVFDIVLEPI